MRSFDNSPRSFDDRLELNQSSNSQGWRPADALLFDPKRFVTSPRGIKAVCVGAATWMVYEATMRLMQVLAAHGRQLDEEDRLENEYRATDWTDRGN